MTDIAHALRELLLARAAGQITAEEFERRQAALHAELLLPAAPKSGGKWRWALAIVVVAAAGGLYFWLGNPAGIATAPTASPPMTDLPRTEGQQAGSGGDLKVMAGRLADKLAKDPKNGEGWVLLAQTYLELRQHKQAADAFAKAAELRKLDAGALANWADAYVVGNDRKWDAKARDLVARALAADPKHLKALALAGSEAFDRKDYKQAIVHWKKMRAVAPADSMDAKLADANIAEATAVMSGKQQAPAADTGASAAAGAVIAGIVVVDPALKSRLAPTDTVFVVAKSTDGAGAPLAVKRFTAAELPVSFKLGDEDAIMPERRLSRFGEVQVTARISRSGDAIARPGDIASAPVRVKVGTTDVKLTILP